MIDDLTTWQTTLAALPQVGDSSWAGNFAAWVDDRVSSKMSLPGIGGPGLSFTFSVSTFETELLGLEETGDQAAAMEAFADAWGLAMSASTAAVAVNSYIEPIGPTTTWSQVDTTVIDPGSIADGKVKINELATSEPVEDAADSDFAVIFREAFLLLTITTSGLDSTPPGSGGPLPLVDTERPVA